MSTLFDPSFASNKAYHQFVASVLESLQVKVISSSDIPIGSIMICISISGALIQFCAIYLIHFNKRITDSVKIFLIFSLIVNLLHFFTQLYLTSCIFRPHCLSTLGYPWSGMMLNQILSTLHYTAPHISIAFLHIITVIRGSFVFSFQRLPRLFSGKFAIVFGVFLIAAIVAPLLCMIGRVPAKEFGYEYAYFGMSFDTNYYFVDCMADGWGGMSYWMEKIFLFFVSALKYFCIIALLVDLATLRRYLNYQTFSTSSSGSGKHADVRFSLQMTFLHVCALAVLFSDLWIPYFYHDFGDLYGFFSWELLLNIFCFIIGCLVAYYNQRELSKKSFHVANRSNGVLIAVVSSNNTR